MFFRREVLKASPLARYICGTRIPAQPPSLISSPKSGEIRARPCEEPETVTNDSAIEKCAGVGAYSVLLYNTFLPLILGHPLHFS